MKALKEGASLPAYQFQRISRCLAWHGDARIGFSVEIAYAGARAPGAEEYDRYAAHENYADLNF